MMSVPYWLPDFLNTLSGILLIIPVIQLNNIAKLVWQLEKIEFNPSDAAFFKQERDRAANNLRRKESDWSLLNDILLKCGIATLLLAFMVKLLS